jgi:hypothetical protein
MTLQGEVFATIVGGKIIYQDGKIIGSSGDGNIVTPQRSQNNIPTLERAL